MNKLLVPLTAIAVLMAACGGSEADSASNTAVPSPVLAATTASAAPTATTAPAATAPSTAEPTAEPPTEVPATEAPPPPTPAVAPTTAPAPPAPLPTSPPPAAGGAPVTLAVVATNLTFDRQSISVPANTQVTVNFTNNDNAVPHDFGVSVPGVAHTSTCNGPCTASISFNSGAPGTFSFQCSIHADMVGVFTVG